MAMCPIVFRVAMQRGEVTPGQSDTSSLGAVPSGATPGPARFSHCAGFGVSGTFPAADERGGSWRFVLSVVRRLPTEQHV